MKKSNVLSVGVGSLVLTALAVGAWFMFYSEPVQKKNMPVSSSSPSQSPHQETQEQKIKASLEKDTPHSGEQQNLPAELVHEEPSATHEMPAENLSKETSEENYFSENGERTETGTSSAHREVNTNKEKDSEEKITSELNKAPTTAQPAPSFSENHVSAASDKSSEENETKKRINEIKKALLQSEVLSDEVDKKIHTGPSCTQVSPTLSNFFNKLEEKQYDKESKRTRPLQEHFNGLATQLVNNPPVVTHETDELYTLLTNTAHFFRILGKDNMRLLQKVVKQENREFEKIAAEVYRLSLTGEECVSGKKKLEIPFTSAYEYAGFFLNTLGGRSYLFRRAPGTRLLVNYYAVLILDQANQKNLNAHGLDMAEHLPWLIQEMEANNQLANKERYLDKLYELAEKYQALP